MKNKLTTLLLIVGASLAIAQTIDIMSQKVAGPNEAPAKAATSTAVGSYAIIDKDNNIVANGYDGTLQFDGATYDRFKTTFAITDPTAARTITFPNSSGTVALNPLGASMEFEGATANAYETTLAVVDPTADRTITLPDISGTVRVAVASTTTALTADDQAVTPGKNTVLQLTSDNATATNRTFTLSATGAVTGGIYILVGPATNQCEIAATGIQKLSATWSPTTSDTLTLLFDGTNFLELARSNN